MCEMYKFRSPGDFLSVISNIQIGMEPSLNKADNVGHIKNYTLQIMDNHTRWALNNPNRHYNPYVEPLGYVKPPEAPEASGGGGGNKIKIKRSLLGDSKKRAAERVVHDRYVSNKEARDANLKDVPCIWKPARAERKYSKCIKGSESEFPSALSLQRCIQGKAKCAPRKIKGTQRKSPISSWTGWAGNQTRDRDLLGDIDDWVSSAFGFLGSEKKAIVEHAKQSIVGEYLFGSIPPSGNWTDAYKLDRLRQVLHTPHRLPPGQTPLLKTEEQRVESLMREWEKYTEAAGDQAYAYTPLYPQPRTGNPYVSDDPSPAFEDTAAEPDCEDDSDASYFTDPWEWKQQAS
jgi:hypothetical protein